MPTLYKVNTPEMTVAFSTEVWTKLMKFAEAMDKNECAAMGTVERTGNLFTITDLLVYPQEVSAAFVTTNDTEYGKWLDSLSDKQINSLKFQVHSHVKMSPSPSTTDIDTREALFDQEEDFLISMIVNQKAEYSLYLYDAKTNLVYDTNEINVIVLCNDGTTIHSWIQAAKKQIKDKPLVTADSKAKAKAKVKEVSTYVSEMRPVLADDYNDSYWRHMHDY